MAILDENAARRTASTFLVGARARVMAALNDLYDGAPAYAGEVESVKESIDQALRVLNGEPVD